MSPGADRLLAENRDNLDALARALLSAEFLDGEEILAAVGLMERPVPEPKALEPVAFGAAETAAVPS